MEDDILDYDKSEKSNRHLFILRVISVALFLYAIIEVMSFIFFLVNNTNESQSSYFLLKIIRLIASGGGTLCLGILIWKHKKLGWILAIIYLVYSLISNIHSVKYNFDTFLLMNEKDVVLKYNYLTLIIVQTLKSVLFGAILFYLNKDISLQTYRINKNNRNLILGLTLLASVILFYFSLYY